MMQQLATQSSQIAALPDAPVTLPAAVPANDAGKAQFADVFAQQQYMTQSTAKATSQPKADADSQTNSAKDQELQTSADTPLNLDTSADKEQRSDVAVQSKAENERHKSVETDTNVAGSQQYEGEYVQPFGDNELVAVTESNIELAEADSTDNLFAQQQHNQSISKTSELNLPLVEQSKPTAQSEPDYLAFVEAIREFHSQSVDGAEGEMSVGSAYANNLLPHSDMSAADTTDIASELNLAIAQWFNLPVNERGEIAPMGPDDEAAISNAEAILSDVMALLSRLKKSDKTPEQPILHNENLNTDQLMVTPALAAEGKQHAEPLPEPLTIAIQLLTKLDRLTASSDSTPAEQAINQSPNNVTVDELTLDIEQLTEAVIEVEESADPLLSQAKLLVGFMKQSSDANLSGEQTTHSTDATTKPITDGVDSASVLQQQLSQASNETLTQLAQVITDSTVMANPTLSDSQQSQIKGALVTGLEEIRAQLKQGHQPALDLAALVSQVVTEVQPDQPAIAPQQLLQDAQQIAQLASASIMTDQKETHLNELLHAAREVVTHESRQQHTETMKTLQQASMDKPLPLNQPQGQQQLAEKIRWMVNGRQSMAEIRLDPPEMGSMQVRLNISGDTAAVSFVVQSQQTRDMLADAMPRLRDMMAEQGIDLGESFVSQQQAGKQQEGQGGNRSEEGGNRQISDETHIDEPQRVRQANSLIDDYV